MDITDVFGSNLSLTSFSACLCKILESASVSIELMLPPTKKSELLCCAKRKTASSIGAALTAIMVTHGLYEHLGAKLHELVAMIAVRLLTLGAVISEDNSCVVVTPWLQCALFRLLASCSQPNPHRIGHALCSANSDSIIMQHITNFRDVIDDRAVTARVSRAATGKIKICSALKSQHPYSLRLCALRNT